MRCRAFTLVEVMLALTLGLLVAYTAFAAFSALSKTLLRARTVSTQNQLLTAGVLYALNEMDFFAACNDPGNPASGHLFLANPNPTLNHHARPFNRLNFRGISPAPISDGMQRFFTDYRPDDPRWWYRFTLCWPTSVGAPAQMPDYTLPVLPSDPTRRAIAPRPFPAVATTGRPLDPSHPFQFYAEAIEEFAFRLGYYGLFEYWPPGLPLGCTDPNAVRAGWLGGSPSGYQVVNLGGGRSNNLAGRNRDYETWPVGMTYANRVGLHFAIASTVFPGNDSVNDGYNRLAFNNYNVDNAFLAAIPLLRLIPQGALDPLYSPQSAGPATWPDVLVQVRRLWVRGQFIHQAAVNLVDGRSGETVQLRFNAPASSLRGARLARNLDP